MKHSTSWSIQPRRRVSSAAVGLICLFLAGCAGTTPDRYSLPFIYRGLGVGPTPNPHEAILQEGQELYALKKAIVKALQARNAAPISEDDKKIVSDGPIQLGRDEVDRYNAAVASQRRLSNDRQYGLQYTITYDLHPPNIDLTVAALLSERGSNNPWKPLKAGSQYQSLYFTTSLRDDIQSALVAASTNSMGSP
jgi:hypothetical protein